MHLNDLDGSAGPFVTLAKAPLRVSLAGGGSDLPSYASRYGGAVVTLSISRYVCVAAYPRSFDGGVWAHWEYPDNAVQVDLLANPLARAALKRCGWSRSLQVASFGDAPGGSGLGGSAAFTVALLHALDQQRPTPVTRRDLAERASAVEMQDLRRPVGKHDHYISAFGGLRLLSFDADGAVDVRKLAVPTEIRDYLRDQLLLFHTGRTRDAGAILGAQAQATGAGHGPTVERLHAIRGLVEPMCRAIEEGATDRIGPLLDEHWNIKRRLSAKVSDDNIENLYQLALTQGADGGKLLGAGGGGFLLISSRSGRQPQIRQAMTAAGATELSFDYADCGAEGVKIPL